MSKKKASPKKKATPKKVDKVKAKQKPVRKFKTKDKKDVVVQEKKARDVKEVKKEAIPIETLKHIISTIVQNQLKEQVTSRGQVPTEPFNVLQRSQSSVEIKRDAKNKVVFTIKAYADTSFLAAKDAITNFNKVLEAVDSDEED